MGIRKRNDLGDLPSDPADLLQVAYDDLCRVEQSKKFSVNMSSWGAVYNDTCSVCLAGAVMMQHSKAARETLKQGSEIYPSDVTHDMDLSGLLRQSVLRKIYGLNAFRMGHIYIFLEFLNVPDEARARFIVRKDYRRIRSTYCPYGRDSEAFKRWMVRMIELMRSVKYLRPTT